MMIVRMNESHVKAVAELEKLCFSDPWSENSVASELKNKLALWLVAEEEGRVAGYIGSQTCTDESDVMNVAVHPDFRRQGIGERLILDLIDQLNQRGNHSLTLEVRTSNVSAIALYRKLGFEQVGLRKNYYRNPKEDALILRKEWES